VISWDGWMVDPPGDPLRLGMSDWDCGKSVSHVIGFTADGLVIGSYLASSSRSESGHHGVGGGNSESGQWGHPGIDFLPPAPLTDAVAAGGTFFFGKLSLSPFSYRIRPPSPPRFFPFSRLHPDLPLRPFPFPVVNVLSAGVGVIDSCPFIKISPIFPFQYYW